MEIEFRVRIIGQEKRQQLAASSLFTAAAVLLSIFISLFVPVLSGLLIGVGIFLSYLSFKPYLKILAQEKTPDKLSITHQRLIFFSKDKKVVSIPLRAIRTISYDEGIIVYLKKPVLEPIEVFDAAWLKNTKGGDFFFEWFEPNVFAMINQELRPS